MKNRGKKPAAWSALLDRHDVLILDTETTGLGQRDEVVEVAVTNTRGEVLFNELIRPICEIGESATRIHGITNAMVAVRPSYRHLHDQLMQVLGPASAVCAWNAPFDRRLLEQSASRYGLELPNIRWRDLVSDHRSMFPHYTSHRLLEVARSQGVATVQDHRALGDCKITLAVVRAQAQVS